jgi:hypothetical protein
MDATSLHNAYRAKNVPFANKKRLLAFAGDLFNL